MKRTVQTMTKLKPCPFCGREPSIERDKFKNWLIWCCGERHEANIYARTKKEATNA